ncbi:pyridoxal-dependent decarboxylase [Rhodococcus erythropolis]|uniref:pyridoxal phosphate-dependent decarboxylase family protein n=1 Tax=Rhodococcus erythropolis TaxID=1833 RepID=UPI001E284DA6|nr:MULTISPECIES: pyridoxal-dependent decarboxylase [Rhodococcus erythropolis group]MCD2104581.1 pyridoxal-dependent decarboxylase [Rhodococcus qingshengii]MCZ4525294.1 pyridoxal-dependent decarboxylase [Rhodococcus erythropolis]
MTAPDRTASLLTTIARYSERYVREGRADSTRVEADRDRLRADFVRPLPRRGEEPHDVVSELVSRGEPGLLHSGAPTFLGFVMGGAYPVAVATEWLTSVWDQCGALYATSPVASVVEETVARWLIDLFGLPSGVSVGVTTGCATANLTGLAAARHSVLADAGWNVDDDGLIGAPAPRILVSKGCHVTVSRAIRLLGMAGQVYPVDVDEQGRMSLPAFIDRLDSTTGPLIVCAQVGNVDSGSVDPLTEICRLTHERGGWVHVDAAFGMWAAAGPTVRRHVSGLAAADSWATDAHKWLNVPYDCGIALCAHPDAHRAALRTSAEYLTVATGGDRDPVDYSPDMSRRARSLVLWATLRHLGRDGVADLIDRCCRLARELASSLDDEPGITVVNDVVLNQVLVRFDAPDGDAAGHLGRIVDTVQRCGTGWASPTTWFGHPTLRLSVCNWQTDSADIERCIDALVGAHRQATSVHSSAVAPLEEFV